MGYTPKIRTEFDAYKNKRKVLAMFVPKRQNLSQAPHGRKSYNTEPPSDGSKSIGVLL